jgi:HK97 family phage prohead protease
MLKRHAGEVRKFVGGTAQTLGDRQIRVVASDASTDHAGDIVEPLGCDLSAYRTNPIVLADHDPTKPIGNASIAVTGSAVTAVITFAPRGASAKADEYCALAKAGVLAGVSIGFTIIDAKPLSSTGGMRIAKWMLLEISLVAVPCNQSAIVVERSLARIRKSGRVLSQVNQDHLDGLISSLDKAANLHAETRHHIAKAMRHAAAIEASAAGAEPDDDDENQPGDSDEDPDTELGFAAAHRERMIEVMELSEPPLSVDEEERAARLRMVGVLELALCP